jgi:phosphate uptake regulator
MFMKYRSLVQQGGGLTVSLPANWIQANGLKKGDFVRIDEDLTGGLVIKKAV